AIFDTCDAASFAHPFKCKGSRHKWAFWPPKRRQEGTGVKRSVDSVSSERPAGLLVEPGLLMPAAVVGDLVQHEALHVRVVGGAVDTPAHGRARAVLFELLLDLPDHGKALLSICLLGLLVDETHHLLVAVVAVVARGAARVVLVEVGVGIVHAEPGEIGPDLELAPRGHGMPLR